MLPQQLANRAAAEFRRFSHPGLDPGLVHTVGFAEWAERIVARAGLRDLAQRIDRIGNRQFVRHLASSIESDRPFALWGFNGSSLSSFELAKARGRTCILDRTNGDFRIYNAMMAEVAERYGEWFVPTERAEPQANIERDQREYEVSDRILVGSPFAAQTIRDGANDPAISAKLKVLNYCFDEALFAATPAPKPVTKAEPVKFLFLGLVIPRKGIHLILEALSRIPREQAELTIVGANGIPPSVFARYADRVTYLPTVARSDVPRIMSEHHAFLLPSYFEGAGITLYEALASGCALIQSRHCAEAVTPQTGIMLDKIDTDHVHAAMLKVIEDRDQLNAWRAAAQGEAANYSFA
ncbi:MAG: glycosyltransferase family 4 protein, partial [Novosphingobium sp.]